MAIITGNTSYGTSTAVTFTGTSLASSSTLLAGRTSTAVDNTSTKALDYAVTLNLRLGTTPTASTQVEFWISSSEDGTIFAGGNGSSDANKTHTADSKAQMKLLQILPVSAATSNVDITLVIESLVSIIGAIPRKFSFWIVHNTVAAANSTANTHFITATALPPQSA